MSRVQWKSNVKTTSYRQTKHGQCGQGSLAALSFLTCPMAPVGSEQGGLEGAGVILGILELMAASWLSRELLQLKQSSLELPFRERTGRREE